MFDDYRTSLSRYRASQERLKRGDALTGYMLAQSRWRIDLSLELLRQPLPTIAPISGQTSNAGESGATVISLGDLGVPRR